MMKVAIRTRLTVLRDGATAPASIAFCSPEKCSVPLSRCATCGFGDRFTCDERGRLAIFSCSRTVPTRPTAHSSDDLSRDDGGGVGAAAPSVVSVGLALTRPFVCFAADAPIGVVARFLQTESNSLGFPVVDDRGRLVGTLARGTAALALASSRGRGRAVGELVVPPRAVSERDSLADTFAAMCERGVQEVAVRGEGGALVGVLRDIDALWVVGRPAESDTYVRAAAPAASHESMAPVRLAGNGR